MTKKNKMELQTVACLLSYRVTELL